MSQINTRRAAVASIGDMFSRALQSPVEPPPPAALLRRFDRPPARPPALPPLAAYSTAFGPATLRTALDARDGSDGPEARLPVHLLARVACGACSRQAQAGTMLLCELDALAAAFSRKQDVGRVTLQICDCTRVEGQDAARLVERIMQRFRMRRTEICIESRRIEAAAFRGLRAAGAERLVIDEAGPDDVEAACGLGLAVTARVACGRRGQTEEDLARALASLAGAGASRVELHASACNVETGPDLCSLRDAQVPLHVGRSVMRAHAIGVLQQLGFRHVGLGLFARPGDPLAVAREHRALQLDVDGFTTEPCAGTLAIGAGAFGRLGSAHYRNAAGVAAWIEAVARDGLSAAAGVTLSPRALALHAMVAALVCHGRVDFEAIALGHLVDPKRSFARELRELAPMARAGLVDVDDEGIELTPQGEHLADVVAAVFEH